MGSNNALLTGHIDELRAKLRLSDFSSRCGALDELRSWDGRPLDADAASTVLRAATVGYPWVKGCHTDVGEQLISLLWAQPSLVDVEEVERAYSFCSDRARRSILRLVALRGDDAGVVALAHLLGLDGPWDLLPVPFDDLLLPIMAAPSAGRLAVPLASVAWRRGWAQHSADMLFEVCLDDKLSPADAIEVAELISPLVLGLVDTCDRAMLPPGNNHAGDVSRVERRRLGSLLPIFALLPEEASSSVLLRALSCADPRVAAHALVVMARRGMVVAEDRVSIVSRDPEARSILFSGLEEMGWHFAIPADCATALSVGEAEVVSWLASETQLGIAPSEVEHRGTLPAPKAWGPGVLHLFAFRLNAPHWSAERGWMIAAVGPFDPLAEFHPKRLHGFAAFSLYASEAEDCVEGHILAISDALLCERPDTAA